MDVWDGKAKTKTKNNELVGSLKPKNTLEKKWKWKQADTL